MQINNSQYTIGRLAQLFFNANRGERTEPITDVGLFLPYPSEWARANHALTLSIQSKTAKQVLAIRDSLPLWAIATLEKYMQDISIIASS